MGGGAYPKQIKPPPARLRGIADEEHDRRSYLTSGWCIGPDDGGDAKRLVDQFDGWIEPTDVRQRLANRLNKAV